MMKKFLMIPALLQTVMYYSQCTILGNNQIKMNQTNRFMIENDAAQCKECHLWSLIGDNATLESDHKLNEIKIKASKIGNVVLSLSLITANGLQQCSKSIEITEGPATDETLCDIQFKDFKEVKYDQGIVSFFPLGSDNNYRFSWTATYKNNEEKTSTEKVPQFSYTKENDLKIIKMTITSPKCMKTYKKVYDNQYWISF